ncbi:MAG: 50S ribosomal protein L3 [Planctomycetota bacterium]|nr:50S ribosomal protein L3 [Planctomycetota bacterium]MDI6788224.1 50S ribosomal protein L3 [Planctomycetota bacterium]
MSTLPGLLAKKLGMTQVFREDGNAVPVTVLQAGPCPVLQIKTVKTDGYNAVQVGFDSRKKQNTSKAILGHLKHSGGVNPPRYIREFRLPDGEAGLTEASAFKPGDEVKVDIFEGVYKVSVTGVTKGRGFSGMVRRWNKHRGPESHGGMLVRGPGSVASDTRLTHIRPNKHMPGHYGCESVSVENLEVIKIDKNRNLLFVKGAVPGHKDGLVTIYKTGLVKKIQVVSAKAKKKTESRPSAKK